MYSTSIFYIANKYIGGSTCNGVVCSASICFHLIALGDYYFDRDDISKQRFEKEQPHAKMAKSVVVFENGNIF